MGKNNNNAIMCFYLILFAQLLVNISSSAFKWNFERGGQDWLESCQEGDQAPIDISKPFEFKSIFLFYF